MNPKPGRISLLKDLLFPHNSIMVNAPRGKDIFRLFRSVSYSLLHWRCPEKAAVNQVVEYLNLLPRYQSAYPRYHCMEMALLKIQTDILHCADIQQVSALGLLDLSAAFNCVDHDNDIQLRQTTYVIDLASKDLWWIGLDHTSVTGHNRLHTKGQLSGEALLEFCVCLWIHSVPVVHSRGLWSDLFLWSRGWWLWRQYAGEMRWISFTTVRLGQSTYMKITE